MLQRQQDNSQQHHWSAVICCNDQVEVIKEMLWFLCRHWFCNSSNLFQAVNVYLLHSGVWLILLPFCLCTRTDGISLDAECLMRQLFTSILVVLALCFSASDPQPILTLSSLVKLNLRLVFLCKLHFFQESIKLSLTGSVPLACIRGGFASLQIQEEDAVIITVINSVGPHKSFCCCGWHQRHGIEQNWPRCKYF